jgi:hypothetical protein
MNMKFHSALIAAAAGVLLSSSAHAAQIFFSLTNSGTQTPVTNPVLNVAAGTTTNVFLWVRLDSDLNNDVDNPNPEKINGLGINLVGDNGTVAHGGSFTIISPGTRWDIPSGSPTGPGSGEAGGSAGNTILAQIARGAITSSGLDGSLAANGTGSDNPDFIYQRIATIPIIADAAGTENVKITTNSKTLSYASGRGGPDTFFGAGDAAVNGSTSGQTSTLADLQIVVTGGVATTPEPASIALLSVGALGLVRRRRA